MNYWIFQAVPERYDLRKEPVEGDELTWYATRYRTRMEPGDIVYFWLGGPESIRGIYGWGKLKSVPYIESNWDSYGVDVKFEKRLRPYLPISKIKSVPELQDLLILRNPQASNFLLSFQEAKAIARLIEPDQRPKEI